MPRDRTPGIIGVWRWPEAITDGPWPGGGRTDVTLPTGPARCATGPNGVIGSDTPGHFDMIAVEQSAAAESEIPPLPALYRRVEIQGHMVKVRYRPRWMSDIEELLNADERDPDAEQAFLEELRGKSAHARRFIAATLVPTLRARGETTLLRGVSKAAGSPSASTMQPAAFNA